MKKKLKLKKYKKDRLIEETKTFQNKENQSKIDVIKNNSQGNKNNKTIKENIINLINLIIQYQIYLINYIIKI